MSTSGEERFRDWMRGNLAWSADYFGVTVTGEPKWGWATRSVSVPADSADGPRWLRVGSEQQRHLPHPCWDGLPTANAVLGVPKPEVLGSVEWEADDQRPPRRVRADLMTLLHGQPCSTGEVLREPPDLPQSWWAQLRRSLEVVRSVPTDRFANRPTMSPHIRDQYGLAEQVRITEWETAHGDLHWNNLLGPRLKILDWEMWGRNAAGTDPATLYCYSLLVPAVAHRVWETFADILDTPPGRTAQLRAAARVLHRAEREYPDLAAPLQEHIQPLLDAVPAR